MTEEHKKELIKLIEDGKEYDITREDAKALVEALTDEEKQWVLSQTHKHRVEKNYKEQHDMEVAQDDRMHELYRLKFLFVNDDSLDHKKIYDACKDFFLNRAIYSLPKSYNVTDLGITVYQCPYCTKRIGKFQPFCDMCGVMIEWEGMFDEG